MKLVLNCAIFSTPTRHTFCCQFIQYNQYDSFLFLISVAKIHLACASYGDAYSRGSSGLRNRRCERVQGLSRGWLDCSATLAMTAEPRSGTRTRNEEQIMTESRYSRYRRLKVD